jgi:putative transposase
MSGIKALAKRLVEENKIDGLGDIENLLGQLVKEMSEEILKGEMSHHLGYQKHERSESCNARNGTSKKTLKTSAGAVSIEVPRDREASFEPQLIKKLRNFRRISGREDYCFVCSWYDNTRYQ